MDSKMGADYQTSYFQPESELISEEDRDTLALDLSGFRKDQLKVQLDRQARILKISGGRQLEDNRKIEFYKEFPISPNCETDKITGRFDGGMLLISMPKVIIPAEKEATKLPPVETREQPQTSTHKPEDAREKNQERASQETLASDDQKKNQERASQETLASDDQNKQKDVSEKSRVEENVEKASKNDDPNKQIDAKNVPKKSPEKGETEASNLARGKHNEVGDDRSAKTRLSDKGKEISSAGKGENVSSCAGIGACDPAAMLKMARKKMDMVLVFLLGFLLAFYVVNKFDWFSERAEN